MKRIHLIAFAILTVVSTICFQNCGSYDSSGSSNSPSNSTSTNFKAGDPFKPELVPYNVSPALATALSNYSNYTGLKAVVLSREGNGYALRLPDAVNQEDASRALLERCQIDFKQYCAVFAEGNFIKYDANEFASKHLNVLFNITTFDAMNMPGALFKWRDFFMRNYNGTNVTFHAIAIGIRGSYYSGWSNFSQIDANRRSMELCEAAINTPCALYAAGTSVVFDIANYQWSQPLIDYGPKVLDINRIPFISDEQRGRIAVPMYQRMMSNSNLRSVVAISRGGHWYHREVQRDITQADRDFVLQNCNADIPPNPDPAVYHHRCFIYSENMQVVMTRAIYEEYALGR